MAEAESEPKDTTSSSSAAKVEKEDGCTLIETHTKISYKQWKDEKRKERVSHYFMSCLTVLVYVVSFTDTWFIETSICAILWCEASLVPRLRPHEAHSV